MPRSTSKTERPTRRRTQPQPPPPEPSGPIVPVPDIAASGPPPASRRRTPPRLADTAGPDPATPPERARLTIGTILAPHGVRGEFKVRLQTDDPEHLLTIKRIYLGDETTPRTVLGARLHAGNALMRVQGISTPETVERFRGVPLRIRGTDARPLAANEYFLYQVIGLEAFDEAGNRLGRVADLIETGANDVLVIAPEAGGTDILLPSHSDTVIDMDPAAGRIVVRPLSYYGE
ncbi:MAG: ribosome maturation factor RimM [Thermomicrobiales bacterium]